MIHSQERKLPIEGRWHYHQQLKNEIATKCYRSWRWVWFADEDQELRDISVFSRQKQGVATKETLTLRTTIAEVMGLIHVESRVVFSRLFWQLLKCFWSATMGTPTKSNNCWPSLQTQGLRPCLHISSVLLLYKLQPKKSIGPSHCGSWIIVTRKLHSYIVKFSFISSRTKKCMTRAKAADLCLKPSSFLEYELELFIAQSWVFPNNPWTKTKVAIHSWIISFITPLSITIGFSPRRAASSINTPAVPIFQLCRTVIPMQAD